MPWLCGRFRSFAWLAAAPRHRVGLRIAQIAIGCMFLFKVITEWPIALYLWGPDGLAAGPGLALETPLFGPWIGQGLDGFFATAAGTYGLLALLGLGAAGLILGRAITLSLLLVLITSSAVDARLPQMPDGGDNISQLVLIYMLLTLPAGKVAVEGSLRVWMHNLGILAIFAQVTIVYFIAGFSKAQGQLWVHGVALYYISQVGIFSLPLMHRLFLNPVMVALATYAVMFWELMFPLAIASPFRLGWIALGLLFEVGVGHLMGLVTFSMVMSGLLLFTVTDREYSAFLQWSRPRLEIQANRIKTANFD
jgi:hypothetical protein